MNPIPTRHYANDALIAAYNAMLERIHALLGQPGNRVAALRSDLAYAREKAVELSELTREEADLVAKYLERDVQDAARFIANTGQELRTWWRFDVQQVEARVLEMFGKVADQASLQMQVMNEELRQDVAIYQTGEITGPGTLVCHACGTESHITRPSRIVPCASCHGTEFCRVFVSE